VISIAISVGARRLPVRMTIEAALQAASQRHSQNAKDRINAVTTNQSHAVAYTDKKLSM